MTSAILAHNVPSVEAEKPISNFNGFLFKNPAVHCRPDHLFKISKDEPYPDHWRIPTELYFANFCKPIKTLANETECIACGTTMTAPQGEYRGQGKGLVLDLESDYLEGRCGNCGYPVRARHFVFNKEQLVVKLDFFPMNYHPSALQEINKVRM